MKAFPGGAYDKTMIFLMGPPFARVIHFNGRGND